MMIYRYFTYA